MLSDYTIYLYQDCTTLIAGIPNLILLFMPPVHVYYNIHPQIYSTTLVIVIDTIVVCSVPINIDIILQ